MPTIQKYSQQTHICRSSITLHWEPTWCCF